MSDAPPVVLVVEDEAPMRRFIKASLEAQGMRALVATNLAEARIAATTQSPEVIVLDLGLADGDGLAFVGELRGWTAVPIIVVSARGREADKVGALDAGADDYLTKPFGVQELLARIRVALRHAAGTGVGEPTMTFGPLTLDLAARRVTLDGGEVHLTPTEYRMLALLAKHEGRVLTHQQILKEVWGPTYVTHVHYVRVHMAELRKKIERDPARPRLLVTEQGVGYRLRAPEP